MEPVQFGRNNKIDEKGPQHVRILGFEDFFACAIHRGTYHINSFNHYDLHVCGVENMSKLYSLWAKLTFVG